MALEKTRSDGWTPAEAVDARTSMVERQVEGRGVADARVLEAMRAIPRERFVPDDLAEFAYDDTPLPIAEGQTIPQPYLVGLMLEAAEIAPGERVLEVGTGSGYTAAVTSRIAGEVISMERLDQLARPARSRLAELGLDNVEIVHDDGTRGAPGRAPFDAIVVWAGGPEIPQPLVDQLGQGGRLVVPVGAEREHQHLWRVRKTGDEEIVREDLGSFSFVPLIGAQAWSEPRTARIGRPPDPAAAGREAPTGETDSPGSPEERIARACERLPDIDDPAFGALFDRIGDKRVVALGEATHGTSEFYRARAAITKRLIEEHGFTLVAVEADWPDAAGIDRYVRHLDGRRPGETPFARFPTWMWRNVETRDFVDWLRERNGRVDDPARRASFHGLDLYSLDASVRAVLDYLDGVDPEAARVARERYGCLQPWQRDPVTYGRAAMRSGFRTCENAVVSMLRELLEKRLDYAARDGEAYVDAAQNARLVASAERYYRAMYYGSAVSWNLRDTHMFETLISMMHARGPDTKAVIWAHNSHLGNAAATDMGLVREQINIGQLCRERFGDDAALVGFGTDRGTVAAADEWDGPMERFDIRPALEGSYEALCRDAPTATDAFLLDLRAGVHPDLRESLLSPRLERAIGVIYRPRIEYQSHYFAACLPEQFDLYLWFGETSAVTPLAAERIEGAPETYPFGV